MKIAVYVKKQQLKTDERLLSLEAELSKASCISYRIETREDLEAGTDVLLSVGGDGTFLSASKRVGDTGIPILGVNLGRLGFLSEYQPGEIVQPLLKGEYSLEDRTLLKASISGGGVDVGKDFYPYALNEVSVHRYGAAMLGVEVEMNGERIPTYWSDGLLVATSSGSTAYSLSVGGPICTPDSKVLIISPIAPHNLNVRPLIVPDTATIHMKMQTRDEKVMITMDNRSIISAPDAEIEISMAQFSLKRIRLNKSNFIGALTSKLFWGEDVRNGVGQ